MLQKRIIAFGDNLLTHLRERNIKTLGDALAIILASGFVMGQGDADLAKLPQLRECGSS